MALAEVSHTFGERSSCEALSTTPRQAGECEPLPVLRGERPAQACLSQYVPHAAERLHRTRDGVRQSCLVTQILEYVLAWAAGQGLFGALDNLTGEDAR